MSQACAILAGGFSRRMGRPKAWLDLGDGRPLLERVATRLLAGGDPVIVVAREGAQELPPLPAAVEVVVDRRTGEGPLAGLEAALAAVGRRADALFLCGCDQPFVSVELVRWLAEQLAATSSVAAVCAPDGTVEPLASIWRTTAELSSLVTSELEAGRRSMRGFVEAAGAHLLSATDLDAFDPSRRFLLNVNTPQDLDRARRLGAP